MPLPNFPQAIVIGAEDIVREFRQQVPELSDKYVVEVICEVFDIFLNHADCRPDLLLALPDTNRIGDTIFHTSSDCRRRLQEASSSMGLALSRRLDSLGAFSNGGLHRDFPYYFRQLVGEGDIVLDHIPH